jgi:GAF domain-containing protein
MFAGFDSPPPSRGDATWTPEARLLALTQLRTNLARQTSVRDVAETGAEYYRHVLNARTVTIIALRDGKYFDLVNVGLIPRGNYRYPRSRGYPTWEYPLATSQLDAGGGYFTQDASDPHFAEYVRVWDDPDVTSIMGVGIVCDDQLLGEVFHTRDDTQPPFDQSDLDLGRDLGMPFSIALSAAMSAERESTETAQEDQH